MKAKSLASSSSFLLSSEIMVRWHWIVNNNGKSKQIHKQCWIKKENKFQNIRWNFVPVLLSFPFSAFHFCSVLLSWHWFLLFWCTYEGNEKSHSQIKKMPPVVPIWVEVKWICARCLLDSQYWLYYLQILTLLDTWENQFWSSFKLPFP